MSPSIQYIFPPLLGAAIGYVTNYVAIRMLFRPLRPWSVFGLRVPLTPGVIPAKRHELAVNIGEMVGEHLFTGPDIAKALADESFGIDLQSMIDQRLDQLFHKELGSVAEIVPERFVVYLATGTRILRWRFMKHLRNHLASEEFASCLAGMINPFLNDFFKRGGDSFISQPDRQHLYGKAGILVGRLLDSPQIEEHVRKIVAEKTEAFLAQGGTLGELLPEELQESFLHSLEEEAPRLLQKLALLLRAPDVQERIAGVVSDAVGKFLANLGPMAALLGGFVKGELVAGKVKDYLRENGDDIARMFDDDASRRKLARMLRERAADFLKKPMRDIEAKLPHGAQGMVPEKIAAVVVHLLRQPETAVAVSEVLTGQIERHCARPAAAVIDEMFGEGACDRSREWMASQVLAMVRSRDFLRLIDSLGLQLLEKKLLHTPIGRLSSFLPQQVQSGIRDYAMGQTRDLLIREVPLLVEAMNVREVVTRKVDSLDVLKVEALLLTIMQEQFKYINLFGALLGFLIGLVNLIFLV